MKKDLIVMLSLSIATVAGWKSRLEILVADCSLTKPNQLSTYRLG